MFTSLFLASFIVTRILLCFNNTNYSSIQLQSTWFNTNVFNNKAKCSYSN